jgi:ABC-2 type transport system ATP-binding protein
MPPLAIQTAGLRLQYKNKTALDGLTLALPRGGIHAIVGANGAGKSSLFRVLLGFEQPCAGAAAVLDADCTRLNPEVRGRIGFVNEEHTLPDWLRVEELRAMQSRQYARWNEARYRDVVRNFNVQGEQKIGELSRGERAGVNLALTLAQSPELLILDEPTLGLDVVSKRAFLEALLFTSLDDGSTIVYCSHQMEEIERVADNLVILERGRLRHMSAPAEFCAQVRLWVADLPLDADVNGLPGLLERQRLDGLTHLVVFGQGADFETRLRRLGARNAQSMAVGLDRAVIGFLAKGHVASHPVPVAA